jgi:hypothetical protein
MSPLLLANIRLETNRSGLRGDNRAELQHKPAKSTISLFSEDSEKVISIANKVTELETQNRSWMVCAIHKCAQTDYIRMMIGLCDIGTDEDENHGSFLNEW